MNFDHDSNSNDPFDEDSADYEVGSGGVNDSTSQSSYEPSQHFNDGRLSSAGPVTRLNDAIAKGTRTGRLTRLTSSRIRGNNSETRSNNSSTQTSSSTSRTDVGRISNFTGDAAASSSSHLIGAAAPTPSSTRSSAGESSSNNQIARNSQQRRDLLRNSAHAHIQSQIPNRTTRTSTSTMMASMDLDANEGEYALVDRLMDTMLDGPSIAGPASSSTYSAANNNPIHTSSMLPPQHPPTRVGREGARQSRAGIDGNGGRRRGGGISARGGREENEDSVTRSMVEGFNRVYIQESNEFGGIRPSDDVTTISHDEAQFHIDFVRNSHAKWTRIVPSQIFTFLPDLLVLIEQETSSIMEAVAEEHGARMLPTLESIGFQPPVRDVTGVIDVDGDEAPAAPAAHANLISRMSVNLAPANLELGKMKICTRLQDSRDRLWYNYFRGESPERDEIMKLADITVNRVQNYFDIVYHWSCGCLTNSDALSNQTKELMTLQSELILDNEAAALKLLLGARLKAGMFRKGPIAGKLYREVWTDDNCHTHYWKPTINFLKWLNNETTLLYGPDRLPIWIKTNAFSGTKQSLQDHFEKADEYHLPSIDPQQGLYSFTNGMYDIMCNRYYRYGSAAYNKYVNPNTCAYNYLESHFPEDGFDIDTGEYNWATHGVSYDPITQQRRTKDAQGKDIPLPEGHWSFIKVDYLDAFLVAQEFEYDDTLFFLFSCGRVYQSVKCDDHQYCLFLKGSPAVGKSKLIEQLMCVIPFDRVCVIPGNVEKVFGFQMLLGDDGECAKDAMYCTEVNRNFCAPSAQFNNMVSGEGLTLPTKSKEARTTKNCETATIWAGNRYFFYSKAELPPIMRRTALVNITKKPIGPKPTPEGMIKAAGAMIKKIRLAYFEKYFAMLRMEHSSIPEVRAAGSTSYIWKHASSYFIKTRKRLLMSLGKPYEMVNNEAWFIQTENPNDCITLDSFRHAYRVFQHHKDIEKPYMIDDDTIIDTIQASFDGVSVSIYDRTKSLNIPFSQIDGQPIPEGVSFFRGFQFGNNEAVREAIKVVMANGDLTIATRRLMATGLLGPDVAPLIPGLGRGPPLDTPPEDDDDGTKMPANKQRKTRAPKKSGASAKRMAAAPLSDDEHDVHPELIGLSLEDMI